MAQNPFDQFDAPAQSGPVYGPPPKAPAQRDPLAVRKDELAIAKAERDLAKPDGGNEAPKGYRFRSDGSLEAIPGGPADKAVNSNKSATQLDLEAKAEGAQKRANTVGAMLAEVKRLYQQDIQGQPISRVFGATEYIDAIPSNERFTRAGQSILPLIRPLVAQTAKEGDSDKEMEVFLSYIPSADDSDSTIEQKFKMLEMLIGGMVDGKSPTELLGSAQANEDDEAIAVNEPRRNFAPGPDRYELASGDTRTVQDDSLAAVADEYRQRLVAGQRAGEIIPWLRSQGVSGETLSQVAQQIRHRDNNPGFDPNQYSIDFTKEVPVTTTEKVANAIGGSALGGYVAGAGNFLSGNNMDSLAGMMGANPDDINQALGIIQEQSPNAYAVGEITGGVAGALGTEALIGARIASPVLRSLVADGTYGGFVGAGASDYNEDGSSATALDRVAGAGTGGLAGLIGSYAGNKVGGGLARVGRGVTDASVQAMQDAGVPMTLGQIASRSGKAGEILKAVEDRAMSIPGVGDMIRTRRNEGLDRFNTKAFDMALEPIRETVGNKTGEEAMQAAHDAVSAAYERALAGKVAVADPTFATDLTNAVTRVMSLKRIGGEVAEGVEEILQPYMNGNALDGAAMQQISRELRGLKAAYGKDPMASRIGKALDSVEDSVFGLFERQTPEVVPAYEAARKAARRLYTLEDAVLKGKNTEGKFTPAQLGMADRQATSRYGGKRAAATGKGEFHDYQRDAQNVLPSQYPDSGTAGRIAQIALPGAIAGSGAGIGYAAGDPQGGAATGLTLAAVLTGAYSKAGQRVLTKPFRGSKAVQAVSGPRVRRAISATGAASAASLANQQ